jgi:hypothetical protein
MPLLVSARNPAKYAESGKVNAQVNTPRRLTPALDASSSERFIIATS